MLVNKKKTNRKNFFYGANIVSYRSLFKVGKHLKTLLLTFPAIFLTDIYQFTGITCFFLGT